MTIGQANQVPMGITLPLAIGYTEHTKLINMSGVTEMNVVTRLTKSEKFEINYAGFTLYKSGIWYATNDDCTVNDYPIVKVNCPHCNEKNTIVAIDPIYNFDNCQFCRKSLEIEAKEVAKIFAEHVTMDNDTWMAFSKEWGV